MQYAKRVFLFLLLVVLTITLVLFVLRNGKVAKVNHISLSKDVDQRSASFRVTTSLGRPSHGNLHHRETWTSTTSTTLEHISFGKLHRENWTSLCGKTENDSYHFFTAYYDGRAAASERPTVLLIGYTYLEVPLVEFYCLLTFQNGTKKCLEHPAKRSTRCLMEGRIKEKPFHYFCSMRQGDEPPVSVQLSTNRSCATQLTKEIPVKNRIPKEPKKQFGVCVGGPLVAKSNKTLKDIVEFIEMSKLMGAELVVIYVNETQVDKSILEYMWRNYPDTVRTIGWKKFKTWYPLHYYGQLLILMDCVYRLMYEVEYLSMIDVDEMIMPVKHINWSEMVQAIRHDNNSAFIFSNTFFTTKKDPSLTPKPPPSCKLPIPKYFLRLHRLSCSYRYSFRAKFMVKPKLVTLLSIHKVCESVKGYKLSEMPSELGILAHYRYPVPHDSHICKNFSTYADTTALKFAHKLTTRLCSLKQAFVL